MLVECVGVGGEFGVSDLANEDGGVIAVDEPVRILPGVEAGSAPGDLLECLRADAIESVCVGEFTFESFGGTAVGDAPGAESSADVLGRVEGRGVDPAGGTPAAGAVLGALADGSACEGFGVVGGSRAR